jgi:hypothetical protein
VNRFNLLAFVIVSFVSVGCYSSHTRPNDAFVEPPNLCPPESDLEPVASIEVGDMSNVTLEAGTRRGAALNFTVRQISGDDIEVAEFPGTFRALDGASLTTPSGQPALTLRFRVNDRSTEFGPEGSEGMTEDPFLLWEAWLIRGHHEADFELVIDVANDAVGTFEVTLGNECDLTPRMWFAADGLTPPVEMPMGLIGNNQPITFNVTVTSRGSS